MKRKKSRKKNKEEKQKKGKHQNLSSFFVDSCSGGSKNRVPVDVIDGKEVSPS